jgi:hypothetical protein
VILTVLFIAESCLLLAASACWALALLGRLERGWEYGWALCALLDGCLAAGCVLQSQWPLAAWFTLGAAACAWSWRKHHRRHRRKRKIAAMLGAKSRALRDAIVRRAREAAVPRRVLSPVPGGAA